MMIKRYFVIFVIFFAIDIVWLALIAPKFYKAQIGHLMTDNVNWIAALLFYFIYMFALLIFVVNPAVQASSITHALLYGALLGFAMYATYDLTNLATLKDWPVLVTVADLVWGTFITAVTAAISTKIIELLKI